MSQQRRGQAEAVSTPTDLCVIYSVLILLPQFCRNFAFVVTPDPPGAITSFIFLDGDQVAPSIRVKQPSAAPSEHRIQSVSAL